MMRRLPLAAVFAFCFAFAVAGTTWAGHAGPLTASCTNPEFGYTVSFPNNWYYNLHVDGGASSDIPACSYFSSEDFELTPGSEPTGVSIGISPGTDEFDASQGEQVTVGGQNAVRYESEVTTPGFEGTYYTYVIDMGDGTTLTAQTVDTWVGPYEENKEILDAMMESLTFGATQGEPTDEATPTPEATATQLPDVAMPAPGGGVTATALLTALTGLVALSAIGVLASRRR